MAFKNWLWFISGFCTVLLFVPGFSSLWIVLLIAAAVLLWLTLSVKPAKTLGFSHKWIPNILALVFLAGCGLLFYYRWSASITDWRLLVPLTVGLCFLASYFIFTIFAKIYTKSWENSLPPVVKKREMTFRSRLFIFLCVLVMVSVCSSSSLLYPINPYAEPNTLMTAGRAMLAGKLVYQDIYTGCGPILAFLHAFSWAVFGNFTGIYILELVLDTLFLIYLVKITAIFFDVNKLLMAFPLVALAFFASPAFMNGDSSEEFCLFFLAVAFYIGLVALVHNRTISYSQFFIAGLCIGFILWIQYSVLGFFIGWILVPFVTMLFRRKWKKLFFSLILMILGAALVSVPIVWFFYANGTLEAFVQVYFLDPVTIPVLYGSRVLGTLYSFAQGILKAIMENPMLFVQTALSMVCALRLSRRLFWQSLLCMMTMMFGVMGFFEYSTSMALLLNVFCGYALVLYYQAFQALDLTYFRQSFIRLWVLLACAISCYFMAESSELLDQKLDNYAQTTFASIIAQVEDPSVLSYNMEDRGFYTYGDLLPANKYYALSPGLEDEALSEQEDLLLDGAMDFIVTQSRLDPSMTNQGKYTLIKAITTNSPDGEDYFLYARKSLVSKLAY